MSISVALRPLPSIQLWTGLYASRKLKFPELLDNRRLKVARLPTLSTGRLYLHEIPLARSPINPKPRPYHRVTWRPVPCVTWEAVTDVEGKPCRWLLRHTLADWDLFCSSQGTSSRAEGYVALG